MTRPKRLLAKSYDQTKYGAAPPDYALLLQHSRDVAEACKALAASSGQTALFCSNTSREAYDRFYLALVANGWIQDLGKASSDFQAMVTGDPQIIQLLRHETISGLLIWSEPKFRDWLKPLSDTLLVSLWGAMGHHRKFDERTVPQQVGSLVVYIAHEDFATILREMRNDFPLGEPPVFERDLIIARSCKDAGDIPALETVRDLHDEFTDCEPQFADKSERCMLALVKGFGIAADVAASAVAARGQWSANYSLTKFVKDSLEIGLTTNDLSKLISNWAWAKSSEKRSDDDETSLPPSFVCRDFQNDVAASESPLTLAQAGCGSGKSLAAYLWARRWCKSFETKGRMNFRLYFCLPTTGTTTEHYKDYALESGIDVKLISLTHSRYSVDLKSIAETAPQEEAGESESDTAKQAQAALNAERDKIESLALWSTPLVITTSDTVLGLMSNARRAVYSLPAIVNSAVVFDEIHAFDDQMFGHLLVFLKNFPRLPVLLMTASLPEERKRAIERVRPDLNPIPGPPEFELLERYLIDDLATDEEVWQAIEDCLGNNEKVLWVRNRVDWANERYAACLSKFRSRFPDCSINVYHSRFRYKDRSIRHRRVIDDFKADCKAAILVATQVAEMSLDLSADLLITDVAPVPALIQRMGRLNRRSTPDKPQPPKPALIRLLPQGEQNAFKPYDKEEIELATKWIGTLKALNKSLNQRDLAEEFARLNNAAEYDIAKAEERAVFFSGLWRTRPGMTRGEGYTMSVILEDDLKKCNDFDKYGDPSRDWLRQHEVAIPIKEAALRWQKVGNLRVAPSDQVDYDFDDITKEGTGAKWLKS
ncbi:MAG TPA: CRISPR-associated helicase Cas3' [Pyrinomonadaceae bacterium]|nr:CRISPR-associated helicase Cas3' [Pyrinomonadaceae bacterium]